MANAEQKRNQIAYMNQYNKENYDRFTGMFPKGKKQIYRELATSQGHTLNGFINFLLEDALRKFHFPVDSHPEE